MRILMITDGSQHAEEGLRLGAQIARCTTEAPTVLTVMKQEGDRSLADAILTRARQVLAPYVLDVETKIRLGAPAQEIIDEAREGSYDLVVVSESQRPNRVTRLRPDATVLSVAKRAPCPVIVAKGKCGPIHGILLCDSGAESPSLLRRFTAQFEELLQGEKEVTILHVMSQISAGPGVKGMQLRADAAELMDGHTPEGELLERDVQILERVGAHPRPKVRHGWVVDEILRDVQSGDYDLVVIGAHRGEGWPHILLDNLADKIVVQLDRPVLVVR
jgi:nucleotide-binding universal stress UspA family protein